MPARRASPAPRRWPAALLLFPGAGSGRDHPSLLAIESALAGAALPAGWRRPVVERVDFPYRIAGRRAPDRAPVLVEHVARSAGALAERLGVPTSSLALGGRSMGGRMCSMAVAEGLQAAALVLVSYPLHPPGRAEQRRDQHLPDLHLPCLFCSGTRDAFGSPEELRAAVSLVPGPAQLHLLEGGDHALRGRDREVADVVTDWIVTRCTS